MGTNFGKITVTILHNLHLGCPHMYLKENLKYYKKKQHISEEIMNYKSQLCSFKDFCNDF